MAKAKVMRVRMVDGPASPSTSAESKKREQDYQAEDDLRTLSKVEEIRGDTGRLARARRKLTDQARSLHRVGRALGTRR